MKKYLYSNKEFEKLYDSLSYTTYCKMFIIDTMKQILIKARYVMLETELKRVGLNNDVINIILYKYFFGNWDILQLHKINKMLIV
jgi:hypothetical protein